MGLRECYMLQRVVFLNWCEIKDAKLSRSDRLWCFTRPAQEPAAVLC